MALIILFMTAPRDFKHEWFNHVMLPLNLVSNFVDLVSYIRLFAVGTAGYAVAALTLAGLSVLVLAGLWLALPQVLDFLKVLPEQHHKAHVLVMGAAAISANAASSAG